VKLISITMPQINPACNLMIASHISYPINF
jgi:hypothetical protein